MIIRKAEYQDVKILNNFLTLLIRDEKKYDYGINENFTVTNMYENYIEDETKLIIVAEENGIIMGYLFGVIKPKDATYNYTTARLDALYVLPEFRKKGIATALIEYFKKWAFAKKVQKLEVSVWCNNKEAKQLYEKAHFKTASETLIIENH